ncbi:predicted protein [Plenodomus lingam JN3]|uniref:Predicted protein n=1 Tax=Leptosphaeria maculans (strain JN3 / isolate v23.1.3 / race Av1-4-5-6-7-8) TaxID=985895 RepID=E5A0K3_LEPMJ|nr:predicted protein [Plenodomus lingam JN3]CBX97063.1 predicted protein [Plenodomus lingam JN3]
MLTLNAEALAALEGTNEHNSHQYDPAVQRTEEWVFIDTPAAHVSVLQQSSRESKCSVYSVDSQPVSTVDPLAALISAYQHSPPKSKSSVYSGDSEHMSSVDIPAPLFSVRQQSPRESKRLVYSMNSEHMNIVGKNTILPEGGQDIIRKDDEADDEADGNGSALSEDVDSENAKDISLELSNHKTTLGDSVNTSALRDRLQAMGATFTVAGELLTYGNPDSESAFQEMVLHLGPHYDTEWNVSFRSPKPRADRYLWPDLRVLKKVLGNEDVLFNIHHERLTSGDSSPKMLRLGKAYDLMFQQWLEFMGAVLHSSDDQELGESSSQAPGVIGSKIPDAPMKDVAQAVPTPILGYMARDNISTCSEVPRNLGWRFSDEETSVPGWCEPQPLDFSTPTDGNRDDHGNNKAKLLADVDQQVHPALRAVPIHDFGIVPASEVASGHPLDVENQVEMTLQDVLSVGPPNGIEEPEPDKSTPPQAVESIDGAGKNATPKMKKTSRISGILKKAIIRGSQKAMPAQF